MNNDTCELCCGTSEDLQDGTFLGILNSHLDGISVGAYYIITIIAKPYPASNHRLATREEAN